MELLNNYLISGVLLIIAATTANPVRAATTEIKADIVDGVCQVSFSNSSITFTTKNSQQFAGGTAEVLPLDVNMRCEGTSGSTPSLKVTGESAGVSDQNLFRSASSTAAYAAFMLKKAQSLIPTVSIARRTRLHPAILLPLPVMRGVLWSILPSAWYKERAIRRSVMAPSAPILTLPLFSRNGIRPSNYE